MSRRPILIEVCCETLAGVRAAALAGADRVELCAELDVDGLTPSAALIDFALAQRGPAVHAMIRPRAGDFIYAPPELASMRAVLAMCRHAGVDGVVLGCLTDGGAIDVAAMASLIEIARPMSVTCHRAFDECRDRQAGIEALVTLGVDRVLTTGGGARADAARLAATVALAARRIGVIAAGGVRADNAAAIVAGSGVREIHFSERLPPGAAGYDAHLLAAEIGKIIAAVSSAPA